MREIKFRGKRTDNGEWVYGMYHNCIGKASLVNLNGKVEKHIDYHWILTQQLPQDMGWTLKDTYIAYKVYAESVSQYTGCIDKNQTCIYQGDIFGNENLRCVVEQKEDGAYILRFKDQRIKPISILDHKISKSAIVGNVFDNPELLLTNSNG